MTKKKKSYCIISVLFAVAVVSLVLCIFMRAETTVYAAEAGNAGIGDTAGGTGIGGADSDGTGNSFSVNFNGDDVTLSSTVRMLLVLTILMLAPSLLIMLTGYTRIIIVLHFFLLNLISYILVIEPNTHCILSKKKSSSILPTP